MEGRTIARPDEKTDIGDGTLDYHLQWRAGQLPGQTQYGEGMGGEVMFLQWRAGQLPGQTPPAPTRRRL